MVWLAQTRSDATALRRGGSRSTASDDDWMLVCELCSRERKGPRRKAVAFRYSELRVFCSRERKGPRRKAVAFRYSELRVFVAESVRDHGARPWHLDTQS